MYTHTKNSCLSDILGKATVHILTCVHAYKKLLFIWYIRKINSNGVQKTISLFLCVYTHTKNSCLSDILGKATVNSVYTHTKNSCLSDILEKATVHILTCVHAYKKLLFIWYIRKSNSPYPYVCTKNSCLSDILGKATVHILTCVHTYKKLLFIWYIRKSNSPYPYVCTRIQKLLFIWYIRKSNSPYPYVCTHIQKTLVYLIY